LSRRACCLSVYLFSSTSIHYIIPYAVAHLKLVVAKGLFANCLVTEVRQISPAKDGRSGYASGGGPT
jgi:hypothetical protein